MPRLLAILAATIASEGGNAELGAIPAEMLECVPEYEQVKRWKPGDRRNLMHVLAADPRAAVRLSLTKQVTECPLPLAEADEEWLITLAADPDADVRSAFAASFRGLLTQATALDRTHLVTSWAASPTDHLRLAVARALDPSIDAVGVRTAIEHLSEDPNPEIREAAVALGSLRKTGRLS